MNPPRASLVLALTSLTYHHIEERADYFGRLRTDLAPGGRVVHLDGRDDLPIPFRWLATKGHRSNPDEMNEEMRSAGYRRLKTLEFLPMESISVFVPAAEELAARHGAGR